MSDDFDLSDNPFPYIKDKLAEEAKDIYNRLCKAAYEPLKDSFREYKRGESNQLIDPKFFNQIVINEEEFIKFYIKTFNL
jgi:hypothetical protein